MRTTTDPKNWPFSFTITELGRLLGKSPVTLRGWDRSGLVCIPRDESGDRRLGTNDVRDIANTAREHKRIDDRRHRLVSAAMTMLEMIESENEQ